MYEDSVAIALKQIHDRLVNNHQASGVRNILKFGPMGMTVRLSDKVEQLSELSDHPQNFFMGEGNFRLEDTLIGIAADAINALLLQRNALTVYEEAQVAQFMEEEDIDPEEMDDLLGKVTGPYFVRGLQ